jgi:cell division protein FtsB
LSEKSRRVLSRRRIALTVLAALALVYGGFELGRAASGYSIVSALREGIEMRQRNQALTEENESLRRRAATAEVGQRVDRQAQSDAQMMMGELQAETARQQQELQFYRGLVARQFGPGTLRVQELRVRAGEEERHFRVLVTLVQAATRESLATGTVTFTVKGADGTALPLADIERDGRRELPFSLRYFPQIEVRVGVPPDFQPLGLDVEYRLGRNADPVRQTFPWRVEGEAEGTLQ